MNPLIDPLSVVPADSPGEAVLNELLRAARTQFGMDVAFISRVDEERGVLQFTHGDASGGLSLFPLRRSLPLADSYCQRLLQGGIPGLIADTSREPVAAALAATTQLMIRAFLGVPVRFSDGRLYGTFCCYKSRTDESLNERDLGTLRLFADIASHLLEREDRERRMRERDIDYLQEVIDKHRFSIAYQPIVQVSEQRVIGYEALTRFSVEPLRTPDQWFDEALRVGLQQELEEAVLRAALDEGLNDFPLDNYLSLNASPDSILSGVFARAIAGRPLERLMLEVTEHVSVPDYTQIAAVLEPLRRKGLKIAVDDAGAGYASFRHILKLGADVIKLDRSLVERIDCERSSRALAAALIRFGEETGSHIVAEGVETEEELAVLRELGVQKAQGYLLGRPLPIGEVRR